VRNSYNFAISIQIYKVLPLVWMLQYLSLPNYWLL